MNERFASPNKGENKSTKHYVPLKLIHYEAYENIKDAKRREMYFKTAKGKTTLRTMLKEYFGDKVQSYDTWRVADIFAVLK